MSDNTKSGMVMAGMVVFLVGCWILKPARYQMTSEAGGTVVLVLDTHRGTVTKYLSDEKGQLWFVSMTNEALRGEHTGAKPVHP